MSQTTWVAHFGFTRTPFGKNVAASDLFTRPSHDEAVAGIRFCIQEALLGVITGEVGAGKTVALRAAAALLESTAHQVIYVANPAFGTRGLYVTIVSALGAQPRFFKAEVMAQAQTLLHAEEHERRRRVVLILDEAHLLSPAQLEEIRLLTNDEMDSVNPFALILVGQPTLNRQLRLGVFAALDQRISTRYQSRPWISLSLLSTSATTSPWSVARTPFSPTTPSLVCTNSPAVCLAPSTTPPSPRSLQPPLKARPSSTTPAPRKRS